MRIPAAVKYEKYEPSQMKMVGVDSEQVMRENKKDIFMHVVNNHVEKLK